MSFLGDLVNSIGTDKAPPPPPRQVQRPVIATAAVPSKPLPKPQPSTSVAPPLPASLKRKVDDRDDKASQRIIKPISTVVQTNNLKPRSPVPTTNAPTLPPVKPAAVATSPASTIPTKAPPKGSFADIMARAKLAQEQRPGSKVGLIKHQATAKEKVSKVAERRRQEQEKEKRKNEKAKPPVKPSTTDRAGKRRSASPQKKSEPVKVPRAPRPPLHAPQSGYKGTMGQASKPDRAVGAASRAPKRSRYDEYLGTDEEEDDEMEDYDDDDGYGYGSDASSDMEAGMDDIESEEMSALRAARQDDARELALENQLKREKEERRRKLAAMANKRGR